MKIIPYQSGFGPETVRMWRESKEAAIGQKDIHSFEEHLYFLDELLPADHEVVIALLNESVIGIIAYNRTEISQLYIHKDHHGKGVGTALLTHAKEASSGILTLYTFEVNEGARRFYEKHGFRIIGRGHENEEQLPDLLYEWRR